ncbi:DUF6415 family natural product biosynthesis protein [Streptomyces asoensis]|uniref:DUF6415 family natural product biosynthesis protein n=1 Tax=Streptomyces asoensis TaxID=249586 RepID=UPI00331B4BAB
MSHPTQQQAAPAQRRELDDLIRQALAARHPLATIETCQSLEIRLRAWIRRLADDARRHQDRLPRGEAAWEACEAAILGAQAALLGDAGRGLKSAALHVATLGEAVRELAGCIRQH